MEELFTNLTAVLIALWNYIMFGHGLGHGHTKKVKLQWLDPVKSCFGAITISSTCFGWEYLTCFEIFRFNLIYEGEYWGQKSEVWFPESNERCES